MHRNVFISYSRKDSEVAQSLCSALDKENISYFIDKEGISGGEDFPKVISEAILDCDVFLYLASKNSYQSKFTGSEITYAFNHKKKSQLLPFIIDGSSLPTNLEFLFSDINIRNIKDHPIDPTLVEDIKAIMEHSDRETSGKKDTRRMRRFAIGATAALILLAVLVAPGPRFLRSEDNIRQFLASHKFVAVNEMSFQFTNDLGGIYYQMDAQADEREKQLKAVWAEELLRYQEEYEEYKKELESDNLRDRARQRLQENLEDVAEKIRDTQKLIDEPVGLGRLKELRISHLKKRSAQVDVLYETGESVTYILGMEGRKPFMATKTGTRDIGIKFYAK